MTTQPSLEIILFNLLTNNTSFPSFFSCNKYLPTSFSILFSLPTQPRSIPKQKTCYNCKITTKYQIARAFCSILPRIGERGEEGWQGGVKGDED